MGKLEPTSKADVNVKGGGCYRKTDTSQFLDKLNTNLPYDAEK